MRLQTIAPRILFSRIVCCRCKIRWRGDVPLLAQNFHFRSYDAVGATPINRLHVITTIPSMLGVNRMLCGLVDDLTTTSSVYSLNDTFVATYY